MLAVCLFLPSYCYSDIQIIPGVSNNAATNGLSWSMGNTIPQNGGITVTGILYQYTVNKEKEDDFTVTIRNEDTLYGLDPEIQERYILSHTDDWSNKYPETIRKIINDRRIPGLRLGQGEVHTEGDGSITDTDVRYLYNFDPCYDPLFDPSCPGHKEASLQYIIDNGFINNTDDGELLENKTAV